MRRTRRTRHSVSTARGRGISSEYSGGSNAAGRSQMAYTSRARLSCSPVWCVSSTEAAPQPTSRAHSPRSPGRTVSDASAQATAAAYATTTAVTHAASHRGSCHTGQPRSDDIGPWRPLPGPGRFRPLLPVHGSSRSRVWVWVWGFFLQKSERSHGFHCGRRNMARECGTCDRPGRQGLKGEGDGSPQHYVDVSSA
jgi:hypothetical protein